MRTVKPEDGVGRVLWNFGSFHRLHSGTFQKTELLIIIDFKSLAFYPVRHLYCGYHVINLNSYF